MIHSYLYRKGQPLQENLDRAAILAATKDKNCLLWVDIEEPTEFESSYLIELFNFHPLAIEDCLTDNPTPKIDDYGEYLFLVMHAVKMQHNNEENSEEMVTTELDVFFSDNYVVTFHRVPAQSVRQVRGALKKTPSTYLGLGADRLVHMLLDHLVDNYQPILDRYDEKIDLMEEDMFQHSAGDYLPNLMQVKREIFKLRHVIIPQRETVNYLTRTPSPFIRSKNRIYFRDVYDHLDRTYRMAEDFHESLGSMLQAYFSYSSHKLNEVIKHMTVMATLSMPMVVIASVYGMNFQHMPELSWKWGYPLSILLSFAVSGVLLLWMKKRKWV